MTYKEKLLDPRWQRKRLETLERSKFTCESCFDSKETLHIHHGYYEKGLEPWEYDSDTLHCLCASCHKDVTVLMNHINRTIGSIDIEALWDVKKILTAVCSLRQKITEEERATLIKELSE